MIAVLQAEAALEDVDTKLAKISSTTYDYSSSQLRSMLLTDELYRSEMDTTSRLAHIVVLASVHPYWPTPHVERYAIARLSEGPVL